VRVGAIAAIRFWNWSPMMFWEGGYGQWDGRPIASWVLSPDEREYLKRQVQRYRVARSLSDRCRVILGCAEGAPQQVRCGAWLPRAHSWQVASALSEGPHRRTAGRGSSGQTTKDDEVAAVIERTLRSVPSDATPWSIRSMATANRHVISCGLAADTFEPSCRRIFKNTC
jgi:hypothetical protein